MKTYSIPATYIAGNYQPTVTTIGTPQPLTLGPQIAVKPIVDAVDVPDGSMAPKGGTTTV